MSQLLGQITATTSSSRCVGAKSPLGTPHSPACNRPVAISDHRLTFPPMFRFISESEAVCHAGGGGPRVPPLQPRHRRCEPRRRLFPMLLPLIHSNHCHRGTGGGVWPAALTPSTTGTHHGAGDALRWSELGAVGVEADPLNVPGGGGLATADAAASAPLHRPSPSHFGSVCFDRPGAPCWQQIEQWRRYVLVVSVLVEVQPLPLPGRVMTAGRHRRRPRFEAMGAIML